MTTKYLKLFPKPLLDDLVAGRWLPVIGAGMSLNAKLPTGKSIPLWAKLGESLGEDLADFSPTGTLDAISAFQHEFGRSKLIERLIEILHVKDAQPGRAHDAFCAIPFDIACTTNFDFLLERQYERAPGYVYTVVDEEQLSVNGAPAGTLLLKLHGDLRHPSRLVVTEEDYDAFLTRYPLIATYLANLLITKTAVFVGYSLDDPDFRQIWNIVTGRLGRTRRMAYAIMVDAGSSEIARFERRGVKIINLPGPKSRYGDTLAEAFAELHAHWRDNVISASKVTEEEPLRELLLPRGAQTRLCFFSIAVDRLSIYRSEVFPYVQALGFVPVTADDVISPGDNVNAKIDALIDRSAVMVVEPTTQHTRAELRMAITRRGRTMLSGAALPRLKTIIVGSDPSIAQEEFSSADIFYITGENSANDPAHLAKELSNLLSHISDNLGLGQDQEPQRLLSQGEGRAAVISAMTLLETRLRQVIQTLPAMVTSNIQGRYRATSLRMLLEDASSQELIPYEQQRLIEGWMRLRNEIVHSGKEVNPAKAKEVVNGVRDVLHQLPLPPWSQNAN
ncbi:SIR2 family NAD-dependent protein deacylase [Dyella kyungheensis]|uniref:SIR2 family NAD-dependent protein deacylase n=1 Tax=Dyella kyungheensis TaxID=1242174 RepID=UPI003CF3C3D2